MSSRKIKIDNRRCKKGIELIGKALEIPAGAMGADSKIEINSNKEAVVDGCKGVIEYYDTRIKLNVGSKCVIFCGSKLYMKSFVEGVAVVGGIIETIDFCG